MSFLLRLTPIAMLTFVVSSMLAMGLSLTVSQIVMPLKSVRLVAVSLIANFVLMPFAALGIAKLLGLDEPLAIGLLLLGAAAGAPFLPKLTQVAEGDLAFAVGLMVLLMVITVAYLPVVLPLFLPGVTVDAMKIAQSLFLLMLLPLAVALVVRANFPDFSARAKPPLAKTSSLALIALVALLIITNFRSVLSVFGTRGILAGLIFIFAGYFIGWLLGGPRSGTRAVLGLGTSQRNIAAALVVGSQSFTDAKVVVMVVVVAIVGLLILFPIAGKLSRKALHESPGATGAGGAARPAGSQASA